MLIWNYLNLAYSGYIQRTYFGGRKFQNTAEDQEVHLRDRVPLEIYSSDGGHRASQGGRRKSLNADEFRTGVEEERSVHPRE